MILQNLGLDYVKFLVEVLFHLALSLLCLMCIRLQRIFHCLFFCRLKQELLKSLYTFFCILPETEEFLCHIPLWNCKHNVLLAIKTHGFLKKALLPVFPIVQHCTTDLFLRANHATNESISSKNHK